MIELCKHYTTSGYPVFRPECVLGHRAGLWCHCATRAHLCGKYEPHEAPEAGQDGEGPGKAVKEGP